MRIVKHGKFDGVISIFNSIGHLTKKDFEKMLDPGFFSNQKKYLESIAKENDCSTEQDLLLLSLAEGAHNQGKLKVSTWEFEEKIDDDFLYSFELEFEMSYV